MPPSTSSRRPAGPNLATAASLHGKELSYNNLLDLDSALRLVRQFAEPAATILKHNNPCGAAVAGNLAEAFELAYEGDPVSAFGGIVGLNRPVDRATAERLCVAGRFIEAIVAPGYDDDALALLKTRPTWKNSVRLLDLEAPIGPDTAGPAGFDLRRDRRGPARAGLGHDGARPGVRHRRHPARADRRGTRRAWRSPGGSARRCKSNAIVLAEGRQLVGVGAGQMSRLDSVRIAVEQGRRRGPGCGARLRRLLPVPRRPRRRRRGRRHRDHPARRLETRRRDRAACDEHGMAMILTGRRHFRH